MRKLVMVLFAFIIGLALGGKVMAGPKNDFKGTWEFKVPEAPYEYSSGKIVVSEVSSKPEISIKFTNGTETKATEIKIDNDLITFNVEVESYSIKVNGKIVDGKLQGKADTPQGLMNYTATKKP